MSSQNIPPESTPIAPDAVAPDAAASEASDPEAIAREAPPAEATISGDDVRLDPLAVDGAASLRARQISDMDEIWRLINDMRVQNRRPNTSKAYKRCWRLWEVRIMSARIVRLN